MKRIHEIRDAVHVFVRLDNDERRILNSPPVQRLRHIQQLALSNLVYPGATHKRFEHSLGVMELASRMYDVVTSTDLPDAVRKVLPAEYTDAGFRQYWRRVVRIAALCHDTGHLPFSHAAEKDLLPDGWHHERLTEEWLASESMTAVLADMIPPVKPEHVIKLAVGPRKLTKSWMFSNWEAILSEIIVGDAFGADRIDYLLRDSLHIGVGYGRFDHYRLVDTLRILPTPVSDEVGPSEPALGVEEGGVQSAEALLYARYMMYSQVYFHSVRRIYDIHLKDFLKAWLPGGKFSTSLDAHLRMTDNEVMVALCAAARDPSSPGHDPAKRIIERQHFRVLYQRNPQDLKKNPAALARVFRAARHIFGAQHVRLDEYVPKAGTLDFPVILRDGRVLSSIQVSDTLNHLPVAAFGYVFISPEHFAEASSWLDTQRDTIIGASGDEDDDEG